MDSNVSLADIAAVTDRNGYGNGWGGMFGGEGMWLFALLLLPMMWGGGFGNFGNRDGNPVTEADLCQSQSFAELKGSVGRLNDQVANVNTNLGNAICNLGYETLRNFNTLERQLADCCCTTQRAIDGVNYNAAMNTAAINANTTAGIQKVLDAISGNRMADMQNQINQLQLQSALCGVVRYPLQTTYATNCNPFFGGSCGSCCGNRNI